MSSFFLESLTNKGKWFILSQKSKRPIFRRKRGKMQWIVPQERVESQITKLKGGNHMNHIVCVKQIPDPEVGVKINPDTNTLITEGVPSILNPFDQFALEECIRIRNKVGGKIVVISMGPSKARTTLLKCLALGTDEAVLLSDKLFADSDTFATSYTLSVAIKKTKNFDLVFCGQQALDGDTGQVGPELAQHLGIAQVTYVEEIISIDNKTVTVKSISDEGYKIVQAKLPVLLAMSPSSSFQPSTPSLRNILEAKQKRFTNWNAEELGIDKNMCGLKGSPTRVVRVYFPPLKKKGVVFNEKPEIVCRKIVKELSEKGMVK
jgi:electron transfer flavoprotein beta subunit